MTRLRDTLCLGLLSATHGLAAQPARAADQTVPGAGNATAIALSSKSPMGQSAKEFLLVYRPPHPYVNRTLPA